MLTKLEAYNVRNTLLSIPVEDSQPFQIRDIQGLGPVKASLDTSEYSGVDGQLIQSTHVSARNIVLTIGITPDYASQTVQGLRATLYGHFMPKSEVRLRFFNSEMATVEIEGVVESCDIPIFAKKTEAQISIMCAQPYFEAITDTVVEGSTVEGSTNLSIAYPGTVPTGFLFTLEPDRNIAGFTMYNSAPDEESLVLTHSIISGTFVDISTMPGDKFAQVRAPAVTNILHKVSLASDWPLLYPGANLFRVVVAGAAIPWSLTYNERFGGL